MGLFRTWLWGSASPPARTFNGIKTSAIRIRFGPEITKILIPPGVEPLKRCYLVPYRGYNVLRACSYLGQIGGSRGWWKPGFWPIRMQNIRIFSHCMHILTPKKTPQKWAILQGSTPFWTPRGSNPGVPRVGARIWPKPGFPSIYKRAPFGAHFLLQKWYHFLGPFWAEMRLIYI